MAVPRSTLITLLAVFAPLLAAAGERLDAQQRTAISIDAEPVALIGMVEGPDHFLFQFLTEARLLPGGHLLAADRIAGDLRIFTRSGEFVRSFGGRGRGPREFEYIGAVEVRGDTITVTDPRLGKQAHFNVRGDFLGTDPLPRPGVSLIGSGAAGRRWWSWLGGQVAGPATDITADSIAIGVSDPQAGGIRQVSGAAVLWRFRGKPYPFSPVTRPALLRDSLLLADAVSGQLSVLGPDGAVARRIRVPVSPTDGAVAWRVLQREVQARESLTSLRDLEIPRLSRLPRMAAMLVDARDRIWIKEYDPAEDAHWLGGWAGGEGGQWLVLDPQGRLLGKVKLPGRIVPLYIGSELLLGRYRDEWDVQYLAVYRIREQGA